MNSKVTVIILNTNELQHLKTCLPSVLSQTYPNYEVLVVDNASTDGSIDFIKKYSPGVKVIQNKENLGYAAGNNVGFEHATGKYIAVLNPDTEVDKNWLSELIKPLEQNPKIGLTTSKILIYNSRGIVNACGNIAHFTGLDFCRGLGESSTNYSKPEFVGAISGCAFLIRRELLHQMGGFDPDFFIYLEDVDMSWRARLAGYSIFFVPTSLVYHKFTLKLAPWKYFYLERNRYIILLKNCSFKFLVLLGPALLLTEIVTGGYAILNGREFIKNKLRAYWWILRNIDVVYKKRYDSQKNIHTTYHEFLERLEWKIPFEQIIKNKAFEKIMSGVFNPLFGLHYRILNKLI